MKNTAPNDFDPTGERSTGIRADIMNCIKASGVPVTGEMFIKLIFMTESQLVSLAQQLHIKV